MNIVLDLDNTLIYSSFKPKRNTLNYEGYYIRARPHLEWFLQMLFTMFAVSVWTAAERQYAEFVVDNFINKNGRKIHYLFSREDVKQSEKYYGSKKDLRLLKDIYKIPLFNLPTIIIDDLKEICYKQYSKCINIQPYYGSEHDNELTKLYFNLKDLFNKSVAD